MYSQCLSTPDPQVLQQYLHILTPADTELQIGGTAVQGDRLHRTVLQAVLQQLGAASIQHHLYGLKPQRAAALKGAATAGAAQHGSAKAQQSGAGVAAVSGAVGDAGGAAGSNSGSAQGNAVSVLNGNGPPAALDDIQVRSIGA